MSSLKDRLYNYEQTPPPGVWDKVTAALDESHLSDEFPTTIYNAEVTPPENAWNKIATALEPEAPVVAMRSRSFSFFRYAAAAVLIGIVAFVVIKLTTGNSARTGNGLAANPDTSLENSAANDVVKEKSSEQELKEPETSITHEDPIAAEVKSHTSRKSRAAYTASNNINPTEAIYAYNENTPNLADRYFMLMTPDGGIIRMSKKWGHMVCCVSGQEQDESCKDQLKKLQEKIACSPTTTSAGNFMDILSLVSALNDTEL